MDLLLRLSVPLLCLAAASTAPEELAADDECSGDGQCAFNALQLRGEKVAGEAESSEDSEWNAFKPLGGGWHKVAKYESATIQTLGKSFKSCQKTCLETADCRSFNHCPKINECRLMTGAYKGNEATKFSVHCQTWYRPAAYKAPEYRQCEKGTLPDADGNCVASTGPALMTFYQYSAQKKYDPDRVWENVDMASLGGVLFYLHNEVVDSKGEQLTADGKRTTKFQIDRIVRFKVTLHSTAALWKDFKSQFGQFIQFDYGQATFGMPDHVKKCNAIWEKYGYEVGCQAVPLGVSGYTGGYWTSWPGRCPSMPFSENSPQGGPKKTSTCIQEQPGGSCASPNGSPDCVWHIEPAGYVMLDDLMGEEAGSVLNSGGHLYDELTDSGTLGSSSFWSGKKDPKRCRQRENKLLKLFAERFPGYNASLPDPPCDFWR
eukprot:gb/GFBE01017914.1/.p1 GENE.gb/GFBE01017914.1/~~gb/GFBE01017914.1/.p1  ORF type:complete len:432 (+),score=92.98 gb/GFBE01017914.1/:1-1296(+)